MPPTHPSYQPKKMIALPRLLVRTSIGLLALLIIAWGPSLAIHGAELIRLNAENWDDHVPAGKEVDCIYGDYVMRNDILVAVIANPVPGRNANLTVRDVGGCVIDLTRRTVPSDQLSAYYPGAAQFVYASPKIWGDGFSPRDVESDLRLEGKSVHFQCVSEPAEERPQVLLRYTLENGEPFLLIETILSNPHAEPIDVNLHDVIRADKSFEMGHDDALRMFWVYDEWFRQAYGVVIEGHQIEQIKGGRGIQLSISADGKTTVTLAPGESYSVERKLFPGADLLDVKATAARLAGQEVVMTQMEVVDPEGGVANAKVSLKSEGRKYGWGRTDEDGKLALAIPPGAYQFSVDALGRPSSQSKLEILSGTKADVVLVLESPGHVQAQITDDAGNPIPCKVEFRGRDGTADPFFGPDSGEHAIHNLFYTHDGAFRQEMGPGKYDVLVSHGPEYDAVTTTIEVVRGETTRLSAKLIRSVDTRGWISSDFHSHSSPSGDNTASQYGRVLNLLCEHIEFAPCTEHNRVSTYVPHLQRLQARDLMATCMGLELTGKPGSVNHQNAFPLKLTPRVQDWGAPLTDFDPVVQIERLALWDGGSDKLVQANHPQIAQILGDRDEDGQFDGGFEKMFGYMDAIEVHPPQYVLFSGNTDPAGKSVNNRMFQWLQLINLGYRIPGVVNTDAHYNFHGSGFLRNYLKSKTDNPAEIETMDMVHTAERGHVTMTNGPFLEVELRGKKPGPKSRGIPGDDVVLRDPNATLRVRVQCPNWFDINRIQVFLNGRPAEHLNLTRRTTPRLFKDSVVKFDHALPLLLYQDTHVIVAAVGDGLQMGPVLGPEHSEDMPIAVSNPIFVDVTGDGFQANRDLLDVPLPLGKE